jgi:hypothetical protein
VGRSRRRHSRAASDEIVEVASQMFASRGPRTSLRDIAAFGGSPYHHFASKEAWSFPQRLRRLRFGLTGGGQAGDLRIDRPSTVSPRCVVELTWAPESILLRIGMRQALAHARDPVLRRISRRR